MCYPVCGMMHIKGPLLLIGKSSLCRGSGFPLSLSVWSFTIYLMPYKRKINVLNASLNKTFPSFLSLSVSSFTIYLMPYNRKLNVLSGSLNKTFPSFPSDFKIIVATFNFQFQSDWSAAVRVVPWSENQAAAGRGEHTGIRRRRLDWPTHWSASVVSFVVTFSGHSVHALSKLYKSFLNSKQSEAFKGNEIQSGM